MTSLRRQLGVTILELVAALAIAGIIAPLVGGIIFMLLFFPGRSQADIATQQDLQLLSRWLSTDANRASSITTSGLGSDEYAQFSWTEFGSTSTVAVTVTYSYDTTSTSVIREEQRDGATHERNPVARNIDSLGDVTFSVVATPGWKRDESTGIYDFRPATVSVSMTSTAEKAGVDDAELSRVVIAELRAQFERGVPTPGATAAPPAGEVAGETWESGDFTGGSGWNDPPNAWTVSGDAAVVKGDDPFDGLHHLRMRSGTGFLKRAADTSGQTGVHLKFRAKVIGFEAGDEAEAQVSSDNMSFTVLRTFTSSDPDSTYQAFDFDLDGLGISMSSAFYVAFDANMSQTGDKFFVDNIELTTAP